MPERFNPSSLYYLKCEYGPGLWNHEYQIKFKPFENGQNQVLVNKEDVKPIDGIHGLAKIIVKQFEKNKVLFEINDVGDHRRSKFYAPASEIVENPVIADVLK
jgi:hypothetical protein